jgi:hypothetical protein
VTECEHHGYRRDCADPDACNRASEEAGRNFVKGLKQIADETAEFTKTHYDASSATAEKFFGAKSLEDRIAIQTDFAKTTYEGFVAQATKIGALYTDLAKDSRSQKLSARSRLPTDFLLKSLNSDHPPSGLDLFISLHFKGPGDHYRRGLCQILGASVS